MFFDIVKDILTPLDNASIPIDPVPANKSHKITSLRSVQIIIM